MPRFPDISKRPWRNADIMIVGLCEVADGLAKLLSLGFRATNTAMAYLVWRSERMVRRSADGKA